MSKSSDLIQGTLHLLPASDGSLSPALHKLEQEGWIRAEWEASDNNRKVKYDSLTRSGRKRLETETVNWDRLSAAISRVLRMKEA
jgi:PadR family transcriptional regulator PadR